MCSTHCVSDLININLPKCKPARLLKILIVKGRKNIFLIKFFIHPKFTRLLPKYLFHLIIPPQTNEKGIISFNQKGKKTNKGSMLMCQLIMYPPKIEKGYNTKTLLNIKKSI